MSLEAEDLARADLYGVLARLFYAAPDAQFLGALLRGPEADPASASAPSTALDKAWRELIDGCRHAFPALLDHEHTELFIGTGKAEITPYLGHYTMRHQSDTPLVELRQQLAEWGIAKRENATEPEDHIAGLCETMRFAIAVQHRSLEEQRNFFERFLYEGAMRFCVAVLASKNARFYRRVAELARAFFGIEREAFSMVG